MNVTREFKKALDDAYVGQINFDDIFVIGRPVLMGMVRYAARYKTHWMMSDEDDLFQEACIHLVRCMFSWDEQRGRSLVDYCTYNIGVHLASVVKGERAKKRHPDQNKSRKIDIWEAAYDDGNTTYEQMLPSTTGSIEVNYAIKEAIARANDELTDLAKDLLMALANNSGNFAESVRDLSSLDHIRRRFGPDESHVRYVMRKKVLPEVIDYLHPSHIL